MSEATIDKRTARAITDFVKGYLSLHFLNQPSLPSPVVAFPDEPDYDEKVQNLLKQPMPPVNKMAIEEAYELRKVIVGFALPPKPKKARKKRRRGKLEGLFKLRPLEQNLS